MDSLSSNFQMIISYPVSSKSLDSLSSGAEVSKPLKWYETLQYVFHLLFVFLSSDSPVLLEYPMDTSAKMNTGCPLMYMHKE